MACNGVAVAAARVPSDLEKFLALLPQEALDQAITAFLKAQNFEVSGSYGQFYAKPKVSAGVAALNQLGVSTTANYGYSITVTTGSVRVSGGAGSSASRDLEGKIMALLKGLAGKVRQQVITATLRKAGVTVTKEQAAPNGAVVLTVEI